MEGKPVILYANDEEGFRLVHGDLLRTRYPQAEIVVCKNGRECKDALHSYADRLAFMVFDQDLGEDPASAVNGNGLAHAVRNGDFGEGLRNKPIVIESQLPRYFEAHPPVAFVAFKEGMPQVLDLINRYALGAEKWTERKEEGQTPEKQQTRPAEKWDDVKSPFSRQDSRDVAAQLLITLFPDYTWKDPVKERSLIKESRRLRRKYKGEEYMRRYYLHEQVLNYTGQNLPLHVTDEPVDQKLRTRCKYMEDCFNAAFEGDGAPNESLLVELSRAVGRDKLYIPDDALAMRYKALLERIQRETEQALDRHHQAESKEKIAETIRKLKAATAYLNFTRR